MSNFVRYNYNLLQKFCSEKNIELIKNYSNEKINKQTKIEGKCIFENCKNNFCKTFNMLVYSNAYCKYHTKENKMTKTKQTCLEKYNFDSLQKYCNENNIILSKTYNENEKISKNTRLEGKCIFENCNNTFCKTFNMLVLSSAYCKFHTEEIQEEKYKRKNKKYDYDLLQKFCNEKNIELVKDYSNEKIIVETEIEGKCIFENCENNFCKKFYNLLKSNAYCKYHTEQNKLTKQKQNNLIKYGVEHSIQSKEVKEKIKRTFLEKYGTEYCGQTQEMKEKIKQSSLIKYGVDHYLKTQESKDRRKQTNIKKYGVSHPAQNTEIMEKISKNSYKLKEYIFPSGNRIKLQGYENLAFDELLKKFTEDELVNGCQNVPEIWYDDENGKKHKHYVDIFIPSQNRCIEVKSTWTSKKKGDSIFQKQTAAKELGYQYEIWVYDGKGEKVECYT